MKYVRNDREKVRKSPHCSCGLPKRPQNKNQSIYGRHLHCGGSELSKILHVGRNVKMHWKFNIMSMQSCINWALITETFPFEIFHREFIYDILWVNYEDPLHHRSKQGFSFTRRYPRRALHFFSPYFHLHWPVKSPALTRKSSALTFFHLYWP